MIKILLYCVQLALRSLMPIVLVVGINAFSASFRVPTYMCKPSIRAFIRVVVNKHVSQNL